MIEAIQTAPTQKPASQQGSHGKTDTETTDSFGGSLRDALAPMGRKAEERTPQGEGTGVQLAKPSEGEKPLLATFVAGLVSLDDVDTIAVGKPAVSATPAVPLGKSMDPVEADVDAKEVVAEEDGEAVASTDPTAGPAATGLALALTKAGNAKAEAAISTAQQRQAGRAVPSTPEPAVEGEQLSETADEGTATPAKPARSAANGVAQAAQQAQAGNAAQHVVLPEQAKAAPLRQGAAVEDAGETPDVANDNELADAGTPKRGISQMAQSGAVLERPAANSAAQQSSFDAALKAAAGGEADMSAEEAQTDRQTSQAPVRTTAPSRMGVDHLALGRMYAPAGATPVRDFAMQVTRRIANGATKFQIRLDPPELGRVDVSLEMKGDSATVRLVVERSETLDFLARDSRTLERALQEAGVKTDAGQMEFSLGQQGREHADERGGNGQGSRPGLLAETVEDAPIVRSVRADALVDLII